MPPPPEALIWRNPGGTVYDCNERHSFHAADPAPCNFPFVMSSVETSKLVGYPWRELFDLVLDVERYPQFVPHCRDVRLLSRTTQEPGVTVIVSRMTVGLSALEVGYTNRTIADVTGRKISIEAIDGPLRHLNALWRFEPQDATHTRVHFSVSYEFSNPVLAAVASRVFAAMFGNILGAFERRAARLLHDKTAAGAGPLKTTGAG